ncbi:Cobalamin biosynthesis protein CobD/CbiB [Methanopyrus kandleri AV19]|uniref:Probable cobalamin biosynthesis protein CobD n=1 Tax=Methanopyrus kandleri (strain AV19 / DSM 6324 / JCM 9639 / NBRC 100938) TaxID=190192 RepID=Q8TV77_METKA|nr:Cobalamin biosynthesis protein CobD/CbiB [Methanopyrus kandleri AV19]
MPLDPLLAAYLAVALDLVLGDPPNRFHPVAWCGRVMELVEKRVRRGRVLDVVWGGLTLAVGCGFLLGVCYPLHYIPMVGDALVLWVCISVRGLVEHLLPVERELREGNLDGARQAVRWLVSRDVSRLNGAEVASAAVESCFENLLDSVVGPLWWYYLLGWPGAVMYRATNVADAMFGYRGEYEMFGKIPARLDDLLNVLSLPVCAAALTVTLPWWILRARLRSLLRAARDVPSPSSWLPMYVGACALGVRLEKPNVYVLKGGDRLPTPDDVRRAAQIAVIFGLVAPGITYVAAGLLSP